ncbi:MAG: hypothetical protein V7785_17950 [Bermanella sp.]
MEVIRVTLASILFCISSYLIYDLFANGFDILVLTACIVGYIVVHFLIPKNGIEESAWYDFLVEVVDIPFRATTLLLRGISRLVRSAADFD